MLQSTGIFLDWQNFLTKKLQIKLNFSEATDIYNIENKRTILEIMSNTNEQKAQDFLNYIAKNEHVLKTALAKNITYDKDIFDDVFNDTIIKVYNSILKNGTDVTDYKNYFFISLKWQYVLQFNRNKSYNCKIVRDWFDNNDILEEDNDEEQRFDNIVETIEFIRERITEVYGEWYATVFFEYYTMKTTTGCSYKKLSAKLGISVVQITQIIQTIKKFVAEDDLIIRLKEMKLNDALY